MDRAAWGTTISGVAAARCSPSPGAPGEPRPHARFQERLWLLPPVQTGGQYIHPTGTIQAGTWGKGSPSPLSCLAHTHRRNKCFCRIEFLCPIHLVLSFYNIIQLQETGDGYQQPGVENTAVSTQDIDSCLLPCWTPRATPWRLSGAHPRQWKLHPQLWCVGLHNTCYSSDYLLSKHLG